MDTKTTKIITEGRQIVLKSTKRSNAIDSQIDNCKEESMKIRNRMRAQARKIKEITDSILLRNMDDIDETEGSLIKNLKNDKKNLENLKSSLEKMLNENNNRNNSAYLETIQQKIKELSKFPECRSSTDSFAFNKGQEVDESLISNLIGQIQHPERNKYRRPISRTHNFADLPVEHKLSFEVREQITVNVCGVQRGRQFSFLKSGGAWVGDENGNIVRTDDTGSTLDTQKTNGDSNYLKGYHTTSGDSLLFLGWDQNQGRILKLSPDKTKTTLLNIKEWTPISIHASKFNGDIFVGMISNDGKAKITRYNKNGERVEDIMKNNQNEDLYKLPHYIAENKNGDICASDWEKQAVVIVDRMGKHRTDYIGGYPEGAIFQPSGICTDILGSILVCDNNDEMDDSVHMLDQDGRFLSLILRLPTSVMKRRLRGIGVDKDHRLWVGDVDKNQIIIYRYIELVD